MKKVRITGAALVAVLWLGLVLCAWLQPSRDISESERRKLAQMPEISVDTIFSGKFMTNFEDFTLDQFPLRDRFRTLKALRGSSQHTQCPAPAHQLYPQERPCRIPKASRRRKS